MKKRSEQEETVPVTLTFFEGVTRTKNGAAVEYDSLKDVYEQVFSEHEVTRYKDRLPVFVFGEFSNDPAHRKDKNVKHLCGLVLDIDNDYLDKQKEKRIVKKPLTWDAVVAVLREKQLQFIAHTSFSHLLPKEEYGGEAVPKIRVLIPTDKPLKPEFVPAAFDLLHGYFDYQPGVDSCGKRVSQPYYVPSCPKSMKAESNHCYYPGRALSISEVKNHSALISNVTKERETGKPSRKVSRSKFKGREINLPEWIQNQELVVEKVKTEEDETVYVLEICPLNEEHDDCAAAIGQKTTGEIWFKCHHNGCDGKNWRDVWSTLSPDLYTSDTLAFEELERKATNLSADAVGVAEFLDAMAKANLSAVQEEQLCSALAHTTKITKKALREDLSQVQTKQKPKSKEPTAEDIALKVVKKIGSKNILYSHGGFWTWEEAGVWVKRPKEAIRRLIHDEARLLKVPLVKEFIDCAFDILRTDCFRENHEFNLKNDSINFLNCEIIFDGNSDRWISREHTRENYNITQIPHLYNPNARAPRFSQFLREITDGDKDADEKMMLILQLIGYCLLTTAKYEKFFIFLGSGANGKSVLMAVLRELLGIANVCAVNVEDFGSNFYRAQLHGKLANLVTEIAEGVVLPEAPVKAIVSGELITADHKYGQPFNFRPYSTLVFATNHLPHTRDYSDAIFRRVEIIEFNRRFTIHEQDAGLSQTLINEIPGIINMALRALEHLFADQRFVEPMSCLQAKDEWKRRADQVRQFVEECCLVEADGKDNDERNRLANNTEASGDVYSTYRSWAKQNSISRTVAHKSLTERLRRFGVVTAKSPKGGIRLLKGIEINGRSVSFTRK